MEVTEIVRSVPLHWYVFFATILFCIGVVGVLIRRNALIVLMCVEIMLNAVNLLFTAFSAYRSDPAGQVFVFFIMVVAAAEVSVGLALIVLLFRNMKSVDIAILNKLKW